MVKTIGKNIRRQREKLGVNQTELANLLGMSTATVSKIESGIVMLKIERIKQIGEVFRLSFQELLYDDSQYGINENALNELNRLKHVLFERERYLHELRTRLIFLHEELRSKLV